MRVKQALIHTDFHRFTEIGQSFHIKYIFLITKTLQPNWNLANITSEWLGNPGKGTSRRKNPKHFLGEPTPDPARIRSWRLRHSFRTNRSVFYPRFAPVQLQKILGNLLDKLRLLYMPQRSSRKILAFLKLQKILGNLWFSERIFSEKTYLETRENGSDDI